MTDDAVSDAEIADWLLETLRFYGADEANSHKIIAVFLEGIHG